MPLIQRGNGMAQAHTGFFADPKVWIAIGALAVSLLSLAWTVANQLGQNRRWDALNVASVQLKEVKFYVWRELAQEEALSTDWGYEPLIFSSPEGWGKFRLVHFLQLRVPTTGEVHAHSNPVFTVTDAEAEAKRVGAGLPVSLYRAFRPMFIFENTGKTEADEWRVRIDLKLGQGEWQPAFTSNAPVRMAAGQTVNVSFDFSMPLQLPVPRELDFRISAQFKDIHGRERLYNIVAVWESQRNYWTYGAGGSR
jgi:hypothetical protein